jgi:hypothetical protein
MGDLASEGVVLDPFALNVLVLTQDDGLAQDVERVCDERGHTVARIELLRDLHFSLAGTLPSVLLVDVARSPSAAAATAAGVLAVHPGISIVLAADKPEARTEAGFRLVDRWRAGERIVDELELAYIGIPASTDEALNGWSPVRKHS